MASTFRRMLSGFFLNRIPASLMFDPLLWVTCGGSRVLSCAVDYVWVLTDWEINNWSFSTDGLRSRC